MAIPKLTKEEREAFLAQPHIAVLSVAADEDRPPQLTPVWYGYQPGGDVTVFTGSQGRVSRKTRLIRQAGVVSLCVQQPQPPYKYVTVEGAVVSYDQPPGAEQMLAIISRYLPAEQARAFVQAELQNPQPSLVLFTIRPQRWLSADFGKEGG
jgi:PPOX class probable F420-dependent enzyme